MKTMELGLPCPRNVNGISTDPQPDWSFDSLLLELESINNRNSIRNLDYPVHFTKTQPRQSKIAKTTGRNAGGFFMRISGDDSSSADRNSEDETDMPFVQHSRFLCDELDASDDSGDEIDCRLQCCMDKVGLTERALFERTKDYLQIASEESRSMIWSVEGELFDMYEKFMSSINKIESHREAQQAIERKLDMHYKRTVAEKLDNHVTDVQRAREQISQLEERRIRDDAAREEAKRKEKALIEQRLQQERQKAEEEARLKAEIAEKAKAMEAEKRASEEATVKHASEASGTTVDASGDSNGAFEKPKAMQSAKIFIRASKNALELEKRRRRFYDELFEKYTTLKVSDNKEVDQLGKIIVRQIKTISNRVETISLRAEELVKTINSPGFPPYIGIKLFVEKILKSCTGGKSSLASVFARSKVIVLVNSKAPGTMDILLAEMNAICMFTVPKHIIYSKEVFKTRDLYLKAIGYEEMESTKSYIGRLGSYMRLYGSIVQTEVGGLQNSHGLREGWAWLARFLNHVPANLYSTVALVSFLEVAGYALYKRYRNQFEKLLRTISTDFINSLETGSSESASIQEEKNRLQQYIEYNEYREEPGEAPLERGHLDSNIISV